MACSDGKIAIVGMACRFPGGAHDLEAFWNLLKNGESTMEEIPRSRFNVDEYWCKDGTQVNRMMARQGHFLREGDLFDEKFFNLSPREALNTDPQHRILLECVVDALDDAGYKPSDAGGEQGWIKSRMGVFVGSATDSYQNNLANNIDAFFCPGTIRGFASGRISHYFGFQGPSIVYDTACSSGLVSVHAACQSLLLNECDAAIASGTNMLTSPEMFIGLSKGFFISNTGGCRTFDETADGYCRAEGVGVLVLKRLEDAVRDNDKIEAIIVASGTNQSGPAESLTMPHAPTQSMLFESNCKRAGIPTLAIRAVEAHGTGTQAGDYAEMEAIKSTFCGSRPQGNTTSTLFVSSLKPNIGHAESTSGIASVMKAVLMMRHKTIPPHIGIKTRLNPRLGDLKAHGITIPTTQQPLQPIPGYSNVFISVNNFGAPGGNANVILQDASDRVAMGQNETYARSYHVVTLSAKPHTPFQTVISGMLDRLKDAEDTDLPSLSYTTTVRRMDYPVRLAFSVSSIEELKEQLGKATIPTTLSANLDTSIGFVIGGNGSQSQGMARMLYDTCPVFRAEVDHCNEIFKDYGGPGFIGIILGELDPFSPHYDNFICASLSIFAIGYAMGVMWREWGVKPSVIVGHSLGEFAAFVLAGCLSIEDAMQLIIWRAQALYETDIISSDGGMIVIGVGETDAQGIVKDSGCSSLVISCYNGPAQTCVSGPKDELLKLQSFIQALPQAPLVKMLQSLPWHSPMLKDAAERFQNMVDGVVFRPAKVPMILNINGSVLLPGDIPPPSYLAEQMVKPVRFDLCLGNSLAQGANMWMELSAKTLLLPLLRPLVPSGITFLPTLSSAHADCWRPITKALARLYEAQVLIEWATYHKPYQFKLITLPSYPFSRNRHWVEYRDRLHLPQYSSPKESPKTHDIISTPIGPLEIVEPWRRYILHTNGQHLHPGAYIWLALSCTKATSIIADFKVTNPTAQGSFLTVLVGTTSPGQYAISFVRHSSEKTLENGMLIASCKVESGSFAVTPGTEKVFQRSRTKLLNNPTSSFLSKAMISKLLTASMETVSGDQLLGSLTVSDDGVEAVGQILWDNKDAVSRHDDSSVSSVAFSPSQLRSLLQPACLTMFLSSGTVSPNVTYAVDRIDFAKHFHKNPSVSCVDGLCVHVFIDISSNSSETPDVSSQSHVYSQSGSALARVIGFRKSAIRNPTNPFRNLSLQIPTHQRANSMPVTIAPCIPSPDSTIQDEGVQFQVKKESKNGAQKTLTESMITDVLSRELGIPEHSILAKDKLEDLGVDSIMSLLLRDKLRQLSGCPVEWFHWKRGLSVQDLCNHIL